jgi:hypothetical protein
MLVIIFRTGGLDLSRHDLDRDSRSRHLQQGHLDSWLRNSQQFEKGHLNSRESLDSLKNDILTRLMP